MEGREQSTKQIQKSPQRVDDEEQKYSATSARQNKDNDHIIIQNMESDQRNQEVSMSTQEQSHIQIDPTKNLDVRQLSLNEIIMAANNQVGNRKKDSGQLNRVIPEESQESNAGRLLFQGNHNESGSFSTIPIAAQTNQFHSGLTDVLLNQSGNGTLLTNITMSSSNQSYELEANNQNENLFACIYTVETDRVVNSEYLTQELKCGICHGVLMNPMECNQCENCFCMNCLHKWLKQAGKCPFKCEGEDGCPDFRMKPHKIIRNMLSNLKLRCRHAVNGCKSILDYDKLEIHEEVECMMKLYDCPEKQYGCPERLRRDQVEKHLREECKFARVECMYCLKPYLRKDIRDHLMNCEEALMTCPHCKGQFQKKVYELHVETQCEENYMSCGRCQATYKRKYKDYHDCVRHLQNQQKTMYEQIKMMKKEIDYKDKKFDTMQEMFQAEITKLYNKLNEQSRAHVLEQQQITSSSQQSNSITFGDMIAQNKKTSPKQNSEKE